MTSKLLVKFTVGAALAALCGASWSLALSLPLLSKTTPLSGSFANLAANTNFTETVGFTVLPSTTGFSALVQTTWSGALTRQPFSFAAALTGPGGFNQPFDLTITPITKIILGQSVVIGGIELLRAKDATLGIGNYLLTITGKPRQVSTVSYNVSVTTPLTPVPEPETYAMMLAGLGAICFLASRRRRD